MKINRSHCIDKFAASNMDTYSEQRKPEKTWWRNKSSLFRPRQDKKKVKMTHTYMYVIIKQTLHSILWERPKI